MGNDDEEEDDSSRYAWSPHWVSGSVLRTLYDLYDYLILTTQRSGSYYYPIVEVRKLRDKGR